MDGQTDSGGAVQRGELCIGSARLPATIVALAAEGALLRMPARLRAVRPQALRIAGVGFLPIGAVKKTDAGTMLVAFERPSAKVRRKLAKMLAGSDLDLAGPALAYLARH